MFFQKYLKTDRLWLKVIDQNYAEKLLDFNKRNFKFLKEWEPEKDPEYLTLKYTRKLLRNEQVSFSQGTTFKFYLFQKNDPTEKIIGMVALNNIIRGCFHSSFLGYKMDEEEINQGYMTEAIRAVVDFAFNELKLHRIEANIMPKNMRSLRVAEKLGFQREGVARKYLKINGNWEDHIHMVLLNDELE